MYFPSFWSRTWIRSVDMSDLHCSVCFLLFCFKKLINFGCTVSSLLHEGFSLRWLFLSQSTGSRAQARLLRRMGLVALRRVGSSQTKGRTHISSVGRWILFLRSFFFFFNFTILYWFCHILTSKEAPACLFLIFFFKKWLVFNVWKSGDVL